MNRDSRKYTHYETDSIVKDTLGKKLHQDRWIKSWEPSTAKALSDLLANK